MKEVGLREWERAGLGSSSVCAGGDDRVYMSRQAETVVGIRYVWLSPTHSRPPTLLYAASSASKSARTNP